eukprot:4135912-Alexandrium_andersonii.AAC.1
MPLLHPNILPGSAVLSTPFGCDRAAAVDFGPSASGCFRYLGYRQVEVRNCRASRCPGSRMSSLHCTLAAQFVKRSSVRNFGPQKPP